MSTRAARPGPAILLAAARDVLGPLVLGSTVADTIGGSVTLHGAAAIEVIGSELTASSAL